MSCRFLKGVGPYLAQLLEKRGIHTVQDILFHLPFRYQDRTRITPIRELRPGDLAVIEGKIIVSQIVQKGKRRGYLQCELFDNTAYISLRFFHFTATQKAALKPGCYLRCYGEIRYGPKGLTLIHPEYQIVNSQTPIPVSQTLTPVYPSTEGLTQTIWRKVTDQALILLNHGAILEEYLPDLLRQRLNMMPLSEALQFVHRPPAKANTELLLSRQHPAQVRLAFEELLAHHLSLRQRRLALAKEIAPTLPKVPKEQKKLLAQLPFKLTDAQRRVINELTQDMAQSQPMLRLVQGDVGSGKTVVAASAALQGVANGYQVALMAPTELLAEQHFQHFQRWFNPLNISVQWLTGQQTAKNRQQIYQALEQNRIAIIIGTHALFQTDVNFAKLGLVIIDEQHRFGVNQRLALREKGAFPHQLIMTATPIPRTLAMTLYADLALSVIDELPPGRTPIKTVVISEERRHEVIARVKQACQEKRQAYWVCPLIEESEVLQCQAAQTTQQLLQKLLPKLRIGLIHGRLKSIEKEQVMSIFKAGEIDLLVATTVIEVGVDVPNASLMIIENAERLGLAQLHQLRGRVGRGAVASYCVLLYQTPLSHLAQQRLAVMKESHDGFVIAEKDLALRGPGEVLGTRQTGMLELRIADLQRDQHLLNNIQLVATELLNDHPNYVRMLIRRWLGETEHYRQV